jgi:hypothetical protein
VLVLNVIEILHPLGKYKYDTWRKLSVKCYIDNSVRWRSGMRNINGVLPWQWLYILLVHLLWWSRHLHVGSLHLKLRPLHLKLRALHVHWHLWPIHLRWLVELVRL